MKYYELCDCIDTKVVGTNYPQVYDFVKGYSPECEDNGVFSLYGNNPVFPAFNPDLSGFKLSNGSNFTDFLSNGFSFKLFFLSEKAREIIEKMNLETYRIYNAKVTSLRKKTSKDYYLMKLVSESWYDLDFKNTEFLEGYFDEAKNITIDSYEDFCRKYNPSDNPEECNYTINIKTIRMMDSFFKKELDLFMLSRFESIWYASERFVEEINKNNLTGLRFKPVEV